MYTRWKLFGAAIVLISLGGCGLGSSTSSTSSSTTVSATGIWVGTDSVTGDTVSGMIDTSGSATFIRSDGVTFFGSVEVSDTGAVSAAVNGYTNFYGSGFSDGSTAGVGTLSGTVTSDSALTLTLTFTTNGGTSLPGSWSLGYDSLSTLASSLTKIAGTYTDSNTGATVSISDSGAIYSQVSSDDCVINGTVTVLDATYDIYQVQYDYANCTGSSATLNGLSFSGLALLNNGTSPSQVLLGVSAQSSSTALGIATAWTKT